MQTEKRSWWFRGQRVVLQKIPQLVQTIPKKKSVSQIATWGERLFLLVLLVLGVRIALALLGFMEPVNPSLPDLAAPALIGPVLLHAVYGVLLFLLIVLTGSAGLSLFVNRLHMTDSDQLVFAFPVGLLIVAAAALIHVVGLAESALLLTVVALLGLLRAVSLWRLWRRCDFLSPRLIPVLLLAIGYGVFMGIYWRPPGADWIGTVDLGDLTVYTGWYHSLRRDVFAFAHLGVEGETFTIYFNQVSTLLALLADDLPLFDSALFLASSMTAFLMLSLFFVIRGLVTARGGQAPLPLVPLLLVIGLMVAACMRPSWIVESPPVVLLLPLITALVHAVDRAGASLPRLLLCIVFAALISIGSKVVSLAVLGGYAGLTLVLKCWGRLTRRQAILICFALAPVVIYVIVMVARFLPDFVAYWEPGPDSWHRFQDRGWAGFSEVLPDLARDIGIVLIVVGAYRVGGLALAGSVLLGAVCFLFHFQLFRIAHLSVFVLVAMVLVLNRQPDPRAGKWLLAATLLTLPFSFFRDPGGSEAAMAWIAVAVPTLWYALVSKAASTPNQIGIRLEHAIGRITVAFLALAIVALPALAVGKLRIGDTHRTIGKPTLAQLWDATRELTPEHALIFTDQTGNDPGRLTGWNDFSLRAERQFYVSTWSVSKLRLDDAARKRQLSLNAAVLAGQCSPHSLALSQNYDGYFAAVAAGHKMPEHFVKVYGNADYGLYRITQLPEQRSVSECIPPEGEISRE